jgi:hypothetical protein
MSETDQRRPIGPWIALAALAVAGLTAVVRTLPSKPTDGATHFVMPKGGLSEADIKLTPVPVPRRERATSPFNAIRTDSILAACASTVRRILQGRGRDTSGFLTLEHYGVHPVSEFAKDSLVVEGTGRSYQGMPQVWHCAAAAHRSGTVAGVDVKVDDGWPGAEPGFATSRAITLAAEQFCLERIAEQYFQGDTLRIHERYRKEDEIYLKGRAVVTGGGELAGLFNCRVYVRDGALVSIEPKLGA